MDGVLNGKFYNLSFGNKLGIWRAVSSIANQQLVKNPSTFGWDINNEQIYWANLKHFEGICTELAEPPNQTGQHEK